MWHNIDTNERYIGKSRTLTDRYRMFTRFHHSYAGKRVDGCRMKYPYIASWKYSILEFCEESMLDEREKFHISKCLEEYGRDLILNIEYAETKPTIVKKSVKVIKKGRHIDSITVKEDSANGYFQTVSFKDKKDMVEAFKKFSYGIEHCLDNVILKNVMTYVDFLLKNDGGIEIDDGSSMFPIMEKLGCCFISLPRNIIGVEETTINEYIKLDYEGTRTNYVSGELIHRCTLTGPNRCIGIFGRCAISKDNIEIMIEWLPCLALYYYVIGMEGKMIETLEKIFFIKDDC